MEKFKNKAHLEEVETREEKKPWNPEKSVVFFDTLFRGYT